MQISIRFICLLINDVKGNHVNPDTVQTFSFAALYCMASRHDSQWRIQSCKDTFRKMCFPN